MHFRGSIHFRFSLTIICGPVVGLGSEASLVLARQGGGMAAKLSDTFACQPSTQRGRGILIDGHAGSRCIAYCNGKCVILRSLDDPSKCDWCIADHAYPTTVARFSPNGEWVASGDSNGTVRIWARGGENVLKFENKALVGAIEDLGWSHDGERIVVCGESKQQFVRAFM